MIKKALLVTVVASVSFLLGGWWVASEVCALVEDGVDVNEMARNSNKKAEETEVRIRKWRRKYSEVHHR